MFSPRIDKHGKLLPWSSTCNEYGEKYLLTIASRLKNSAISFWPESSIHSAIFNARFPDKNKVIKMADMALKGKIQFWHPWHMELTHTAESIVPPKEWFVARNGDQEWIDSFVRFTHMLDLAAVFKMTGNDKYLDAFSNYIETFSVARATNHRHWKDQLNAALRVTNLIKALDLLKHNEIDETLLTSTLREILIDCHFLYSSLGQRVGNWEVAITTALLTASIYLDEELCAENWQRDADARLIEILATDIHQDGIQLEEVPLYHGEVILFLLDYLTILNANQITPKQELVEITKRMLSAMEEIADPEGMIPPLGDSDRFPINYITNIGDTLLPDYVQNNGANSGISANQPSLTTFNDTGWAIVNWRRDEVKRRYLLFDCSGKPYKGMAWHSHADDLSFIYHTSEGPLITDPGRFTYAKIFPVYLPHSNTHLGDHWWKKTLGYITRPHLRELNSRNWREYFQSTLSHNTVSCEGKNQPGYGNVREAGRYVRQTRAELKDGLLILEGELDTKEYGKSRIKLDSIVSQEYSYQHKRGIYGHLPGILVIIDRLQSDSARDWVNSIHFSPKSQIKVIDDGLDVSLGESKFLVTCVNNQSNKTTNTLDNDWVSEYYNLKKKSKTYRSKVSKGNNTVFVTSIIDICEYKFDKVDIDIKTKTEGDLFTVSVNYSCSENATGITILFDSEKSDSHNNVTTKLLVTRASPLSR